MGRVTSPASSPCFGGLPAPIPSTSSSFSHLHTRRNPPLILLSRSSPWTTEGSITSVRTSNRRSFALSLLLPPVSLALSSSSSFAAPPLDLDRYTDEAEGFTLLKPASWAKVEKAGATALFEQDGKGTNNVGVVVNPVRLSSLEEFGSPDFVAEKLIQAEMRKESTKHANLYVATERSSRGGLSVYEFEYTIDSTRGGLKRIFSAAFVASRKLFLLNIAYSDPPEKPLDAETRAVLEQVLHSFDTP
uniref:PsbP domain-OEC23 like protein n=1 Tax=Apostasia odorata TaxID=280455 RepID=A0A0F7GYU0_9ASPA